MSENEGRPVDHALRRLWVSVTICCWIVALSLTAQVTIWSLATFTDLRYQSLQMEPVVKPVEPGRNKRPKEVALLSQADMLPRGAEPGPVTVRSKFDLFFDDIIDLSLAAGSISLVVLVLMVTVMVMITASTSATGVNEAVSALTWTVIVTALTLPMGGLFHMPWQGSALRPYEVITSHVDLARANGAEFEFYAKFLAMPVVCLIGVLMIGTRFGRAARQGLPSARPFLDADLEREATGLTATSLYGGGRSVGALNRLVEAARRKELDETVKSQSGGAESGRSAKQPVAGSRPKRVI